MMMVGELPPINSSVVPSKNVSRKPERVRRKLTTHSFDEGWHCKLPKLNESDRTQSEPLLYPPEKTQSSTHAKSKRERLGRSLADRLGTFLAKTNTRRAAMIKKGSNYSKLGPIQKANNNNVSKPMMKSKPAAKKLSDADMKYSSNKAFEPIMIEKPFSIRQKIEQFRKWHEEHAKTRISKLSSDNRDSSRSKSDAIQESICSKKPLVDLAEERLQTKREVANGNEPYRVDSPPAHVDLAEIERISSAKTWRTWRDVNESYAYSDVKRYIKENKLLPPDKESWIVNWVRDVHTSTSIPEES